MTPTTDQLKDLMSKVTPGPWVSSTHGTQVLTGDSWNTICELRARKDFTRARWEDGRAASDDTANATLIALAPTLAAEVVRLRGIIEKVDQYVPVADDTCDEPGILFTEAIMRQWPELRPPSP